MITEEKPIHELAGIRELHRKTVQHFLALERRRVLEPTEMFQYADAQRKAGNIEEAARLFATCGGQPGQLQARARFFADRLSGLDAAVPFDMLDQPCPAPLVAIPTFLTASEQEQLMDFFLRHEREFTPTPDGCGGYTPAVRNNLELSGAREPKQSFREKVAGVLPEILRRMGLEPFPVRKIEVKLRVYLDGQHFRIHTDALCGRRLTYTYYFGRSQQEFEGGHLLVFDTSADGKNCSHSFTRVLPEDNCLFCFPSFYFHAVSPVRAKLAGFRSARFAVNGHISEVGEI